MKKCQNNFEEGDFLLKIEYKFLDMPKDFTSKQKDEFLHNEAYSLLDKTLKDLGCTEYKIQRTPLGKPYIENSELHFSVAHTDGLICCVVADTECGIDCEKIIKKDNVKEFCQRFFVGDEIETMKKSGYANEEFFRIWTCKEAIGKKTGLGVAKTLKIDSTKENCSTIIENGYIITVCI